MLGQPLDRLLPMAARATHRGHIYTFSQGGSESRRMAERREIAGLRRNGEQFPAEASIARITINDELARASHLIDAAKAKGMFITVLHMGGAERRDALTNQLIQLAAPQAQLLIIRNDSDADGLFAGIAKARNIPMLKVETVVELRKPLQEMFGAGS
jgi:hypothetical protein